MYPSQARLIFKWRSETLDIKPHLTYKYHDMVCRCCKTQNETPQHIINCGQENFLDLEVDILNIKELTDQDQADIKLVLRRIEKVDNSSPVGRSVSGNPALANRPAKGIQTEHTV